ncbi:DUF4179 domain-containing protein [Brevibacillus ginsengisoli]|uniref:DUF4179 domain-containing protein n=1 Tax=Brevibacillus ginsengisoli TaxID=363854 RepID=UPI003CFB789C
MREKVRLFKQEIDDIQVPVDKLDAIISQTIKEATMKKNQPKRKKILYGTGAAVVAFGLFLSSAAVSPAMASIVSKIPVVGSIFSQFGDVGLKEVSKQGLTTVVGQPQVVGGTALTIDEVFCDGTRFSIGYSIKADKAVGELYLNPTLSINGETIGFAGSSKEDQITPTYRTGILEVTPPANLPKDFQLGLTFQAENGNKWNFNLPVKLNNDVKLVPIDYKRQGEAFDLTVSDLKVGPAGILLNFNTVSKDTDYNSSYLEFKAVDAATGKEIGSHSGGRSGQIIDGKAYLTGSFRFDPVDKQVKKLKITPYMSFPTNGGGVEFDQNGKEKEIKFKPVQGKEIKFDSFTVTLP